MEVLPDNCRLDLDRRRDRVAINNDAVTDLEQDRQRVRIEDDNVLLPGYGIGRGDEAGANPQAARQKAPKHIAQKHLVGASDFAGMLHEQVESPKLCGEFVGVSVREQLNALEVLCVLGHGERKASGSRG